MQASDYHTTVLQTYKKQMMEIFNQLLNSKLKFSRKRQEDISGIFFDVFSSVKNGYFTL